MELVVALDEAHEAILEDALDGLRRAHLAHYEMAGVGRSRERLEDLFLLVRECLSLETLVPISRYAEAVAAERFRAGFDIGEVQTAFNVLEEAIWHVVLFRLPAEDIAAASALVGATLGAGRDALARAWVALASRHHVPAVDVTALFDGVSS